MSSPMIVIEFLEDILSDWSIIEYNYLLKHSTLPVMITNVRHLYQEFLSKVPSASIHPESFRYLLSGSICMLTSSSPQSLSHTDIYNYYIFLSSSSHKLDLYNSYISSTSLDTRSLGSYHMSIDTAVLTATLILSEGRDLKSIPFIDDPEFEVPSSEGVETVEMTGFRYILANDGRPIISEDLFPLMLKDLTEDMF